MQLLPSLTIIAKQLKFIFIMRKVSFTRVKIFKQLISFHWFFFTDDGANNQTASKWMTTKSKGNYNFPCGLSKISAAKKIVLRQIVVRLLFLIGHMNGSIRIIVITNFHRHTDDDFDAQTHTHTCQVNGICITYFIAWHVLFVLHR